MQQRLDTHDARLQAAYPDSYYMNSDYLLLVYVPFTTAYPSLGRELRADNLDAAQTSLRETFPDAVLTMTAPGRYEAVYTYVDKTSGTEVQREGKCQWDCDGLTGAIRVRAYIDGELTEFTEFVPLGGSRYLLYTATDKAIVEYIEGEITALWHAHRISEPAQGLFPRRHAAYESCRAGLLPRRGRFLLRHGLDHRRCRRAVCHHAAKRRNGFIPARSRRISLIRTATAPASSGRTSRRSRFLRERIAPSMRHYYR